MFKFYFEQILKELSKKQAKRLEKILEKYKGFDRLDILFDLVKTNKLKR
jgi:hypothetical protein